MGGLGVKVEHFPLTLLVVLTTLTLPCERDKHEYRAPGLSVHCLESKLLPAVTKQRELAVNSSSLFVVCQ